jgi:GNAT superfamily N-acetyltransferase
VRNAWSVRELELADAPACDAVIATLPYFFGQAAGVADCAAAVRSQRGLVAVDASDAVVGFLTYRSHEAGSAEITWMAVRQGERRQGVGRQLLDVLAGLAAREGTQLLFVITLGPSVPEPGIVDGYSGTRAFYEAVGFVALKELDAWGPDSAGMILARVTSAICSPPG